MSDVDHKSGLPIRSEKDGTDERVHVKIVDYQAPDASDNQVQVSERLVHVRVHGQDDAGNKKQVRTSEHGNIALDGEYSLSDNSNPSSVGMIAHKRKGTGEVPSDVDLSKRVTAVKYDNGSDKTVVALDVAMRDEDGVPYSLNNPLPCSMEESEGEEIHEFFASTAPVARNANDTQTYVVPTGKVFLLEQVISDFSGEMKVEISVGASGSEVRKAVRFGTEAKDPSVTFKRAIKVVAGDQVLITRHNNDQQPATLFSTIVGLLKTA